MLAAQMCNISQNGALFECSRTFDIGELVVLEMTLEGWQRIYVQTHGSPAQIGDPDSLRVNGIVVRTVEVEEKKHHIGISFAHIKGPDLETLREYIAKRLIFEL
jgi:hypothetical protein